MNENFLADDINNSNHPNKLISDAVNQLVINQENIDNIENKQQSYSSASCFNKGYVSLQNEKDTETNQEQSQQPLNQLSQSNWNSRRNLIYYVLYTVDILLSVVLFSPLVSFYWNSTWEFLDLYFLTDSPKLSNFLSWFIGLIIVLPSYLFQKNIHNFYTNLSSDSYLSWALKLFVRVAYMYFVSFAIVLEWRGLWNLMDIYFFKDWATQLSIAIICLAFLCLSRSTKILITNPFILFRDDFNNFFTNDSKHKLPVSDYPQFSFDFLLCEVVECMALVAAWRGIEIGYGHFAFPDDKFYSMFTSFAIGHSAYFIIVIIQSSLFKLCSKNELFFRLLAEDTLHIIMFISVVIYWKFYWDAMEVYIFDKFDTSLIYILMGTHFVSFTIAVSLRTSSLIAGPGTSFLDGQADEYSTSYYDIHYLSEIYTNHVESEDNERTRLQIQGLA